MGAATWKSWLEITANFSILLGLILVAYQLRQNQEALQTELRVALSQVYAPRAESRMSMHSTNLDPVGLQNARLKLNELLREDDVSVADAAKSLSPRDYFVLWNSCMNVMRHLDNNLYQAELGLLDESHIKSTYGGVAAFWEEWNAFKNPIASRVQKAHDERREVTVDVTGSLGFTDEDR